MGKELDRFIEIVAKLRGPGGCPWDREQTHKSLLSCLLDETYEFFEAADEDDHLKMTRRTRRPSAAGRAACADRDR